MLSPPLSRISTKQVARALEAIAQLLELVGENEMRARAHQTAARALLQSRLSWKEARLAITQKKLRGIGPQIAASVLALEETGTCPVWDELLHSVPRGQRELLDLPGLGTKKARALIAAGINSPEQLLERCRSQHLRQVPGFGPTSEASFGSNAAEFLARRGKLLYAAAARRAQVLQKLSSDAGVDLRPCGALRRADAVVESMEFCCSGDLAKARLALQAVPGAELKALPNQIEILFEDHAQARIYFCDRSLLDSEVFNRTALQDHIKALKQRGGRQVAQLV